MAFDLALYAERLQDFGRLVYDLCGNRQAAMAEGAAGAALMLAAAAALRMRRRAVPAVWFLAAACCAVEGQIALRNGYLRPGIALYVLSAAFVLRYGARVRGEYGLREIRIGAGAAAALMCVAVAAAAFLRLYNLGNYPAGLNNDEALFSYYGLLTMRGETLSGWWADNSRYMFVFLYTLASVFKLFGATIFTARATSAFVGILGILALFLMADRIFKRAVALFASFSLALCICSSGFDRIIHCMNWGTLFACFSLYLLFAAEGRGMQYLGFFSGVVMALGLFTYDVYKGGLAAIFAFLACRAVFQRRYLRENWRALLLAAVGFVIVAGPALKATRSYSMGYIRDIFVVVGRARLPQGVTPAGFLADNVQKLVRMLFLAMSESIHLVRAGPILNDALVPLFFMGFVCALYNWKRCNYFLVLVWLVLSPIGGIMSWPCLRRIIIFMPALHICVALGAVLLLKNVADSVGLGRRAVFVAALLAMPAVLLPVNAYIYFNRATAFSGADLKQLGECVNGQIGKRFVYIMDMPDVPTVYFMTYNSRRGEDPALYYQFIGCEEMYDRIFNSPPRDLAFVSRNKPEIRKLMAPLEQTVASTRVEEKQHILACTTRMKDFAKRRGAGVRYEKPAGGGAATAWAAGRAEKTEFDWSKYPLPYPFEAMVEGYFYVPRNGPYEFRVVGNGETEMLVDGDDVCAAAPCELYLEAGAHKIGILHAQPAPGALSITCGARGKPGSPIYLWGDMVEQLHGMTREAVKDAVRVAR